MIRAAGILFLTQTDEGEVALLLRRGPSGDFPGTLGIPGGREEAEDEGDMMKVALREAHEEVGDFPEGQLRCLMTQQLFHTPNVDYPTEDVEFTTYVQRVDKPFTPTLNYEHTGFVWTPVKDVIEIGKGIPAASSSELAGTLAEDGTDGPL